MPKNLTWVATTRIPQRLWTEALDYSALGQAVLAAINQLYADVAMSATQCR